MMGEYFELMLEGMARFTTIITDGMSSYTTIIIDSIQFNRWMMLGLFFVTWAMMLLMYASSKGE